MAHWVSPIGAHCDNVTEDQLAHWVSGSGGAGDQLAHWVGAAGGAGDQLAHWVHCDNVTEDQLAHWVGAVGDGLDGAGIRRGGGWVPQAAWCAVSRVVTREPREPPNLKTHCPKLFTTPSEPETHWDHLSISLPPHENL